MQRLHNSIDCITAENCMYVDRECMPVIVESFGVLTLLLNVKFYII